MAEQETPRRVMSGVAKSLARPDLVLHYFDYGQGESVLVLMGGPGVPGKGMEPVARIIAKRARAIVPDQRGSGASMPKEAEAITLEATLADFEALRKDLALEKWTVWGCSWGGMLALEYASKFPQSLKGLVLVGSGGPSWASFGKAFRDNMAARMTADDRAAQDYWSQPAVVADDPIRNVRIVDCHFDGVERDDVVEGVVSLRWRSSRVNGRLRDETISR